MTQSVPRLLLVDNYDSFTYNLVPALPSCSAPRCSCIATM